MCFSLLCLGVQVVFGYNFYNFYRRYAFGEHSLLPAISLLLLKKNYILILTLVLIFVLFCYYHHYYF